MFLSKSDYMMAQNCVKALWLKKNRKDLTPEIDEATQRLFDIGNEVQDLAREFFPGGVMVPAENWNVINGSKITAELAKSNDILYEAFAKLDNGAFCRIDVLKRNGGGWDLIEIKSATSVKPEYIADLRFGNDQKHSENVIKQILQGQNIWNQIILSPENRSEIQDWFQQMKDFFEDAGW